MELEYVVPTVPPTSVELLIVNGATVTASEIFADWVCAGLLESVTVAVKLNDPVAVGVPRMIPVAAVRLSPAGRLLPELIDHLYGVVPPAALSVAL